MKSLITPKKKISDSYLKSISVEDIIIGATDGQTFIAEAEDVFPSYIDFDFVNYGIDVHGEAKPETPAQVFQVIRDGTFRHFFGDFGENLDRLCFSQTQIVEFCRSYANWLRTDGYSTFFLFKENDEFFVADINRDDDGLAAYAYRFSRGGGWYAKYRPHLVVPQLKPCGYLSYCSFGS